MIRKFECKDCKHTFEADDSKEVICPQCQSDNVDYYTVHRHWGKYLLVGVIVLAACGAIYMTVKGISAKTEGKTDLVEVAFAQELQRTVAGEDVQGHVRLRRVLAPGRSAPDLRVAAVEVGDELAARRAAVAD